MFAITGCSIGAINFKKTVNLLKIDVQEIHSLKSLIIFKQARKVEMHLPDGYEKFSLKTIIKLHIYAPKSAGSAPVLIDIHSGGWHRGSKNSIAIPAEAILSHGAIWVTIDYGLAPDYNMDQIMDHVRQSIAWIHQHISQ